MKFIQLLEKDLPPSMSKNLPKGFKPENQVWKTVGWRRKGSSGGSASPGGTHKVRIDKPTGTITSGLFTGINIDDLHSNVKKAKDRGITTKKDKNGNIIRTAGGKVGTVSNSKDIVRKGGKVNLSNISQRDKERLKNSQSSKRSIDKEIRKIDDYIKRNAPTKAGINKKRDEEIKNLKAQRKELLQARGSSSVASAMTAGVSSYDRKKNKKTRAELHKDREEYSKGANKAKKNWREIRDSGNAPKLNKKVK